MLESLGADGILLSDYGVREGPLTDYLLNHPRRLTSLGRWSLRCAASLQLLARFQINDRHARHVAKLALALFDGLAGLHRLGPEARELLQYAALLHDVGAVLGYDGHGEHSSYIIKNGNLRGLSGDEVEMVANIARYHGQARPRKKDPAGRALAKRDRRTLRWLAAMLRVAEGLDRSHYQLVKALRVIRRGDRITIRLTARREARLEVWAARRRTALLERLTGARVRIAVERPAKSEARPVETAKGKAATAASRTTS
jgi:exopolyphosphatase/guanosine-5'-triphosphate,3'-diphosphate pyrophosphatase